MLTYGLPHPVIQIVMLGEWRQSSLSTASTYFIHIFYIILCILVRTKVLHTFLLLFTPKERVISVIFRGEHRKIDAELLSTFTPFSRMHLNTRSRSVKGDPVMTA